ncbi:MAG: hypothetical protein V4524_03160 [Patescibacteria group bacterium]
MINVEITRNPNENALGVLRRFSRKVQSSGVINRKRSLRYATRTQSPYKIKQKTLKSIVRKAALAELVKQGKAPVKPERPGRK